MSKSRKSVESEEEIADESEILETPSTVKPAVNGTATPLAKPPETPKRTPPPPQDQLRRRRIGNLVKCPHCEVVLHVDKTMPTVRTRRLYCRNDSCPKFLEKGKRYAKTVSTAVQNEDTDDLGVMSARQREHLPRKDQG
jgi:hypothetical protein